MKFCGFSRFAGAAVAAFAATASVSRGSGFRASPLADYSEDKFSFGWEVGFSVVAGEANEHVFSPRSEALSYAAATKTRYENRRHQLSRLDWDLVASMAGFSGSVRKGRLSLNGGVWYGGSGSDDWEMEDYDWLAGDQRGHTHYSKSETELTDAWMLDANVSYDFYRTDDAVGYLFAGAREQRWKWTCDGKNEYHYPEYNYRWVYDYSHCIDYRQVFFFGYLGVGGKWKIADDLSLGAYASWAPCYKGRDRDNHINADKYFIDSFDYDDGNVYGAGVSVEWALSETATLSAAVDWQKATLHEGDIRVEEISTGSVASAPDAAGIESEYLALTIAAAWRF